MRSHAVEGGVASIVVDVVVLQKGGLVDPRRGRILLCVRFRSGPRPSMDMLIASSRRLAPATSLGLRQTLVGWNPPQAFVTLIDAGPVEQPLVFEQSTSTPSG